MVVGRPFAVAGIPTLLLLAACADEPVSPTPQAPRDAPAAAAAPGQIPSRSQEQPGTWIDRSDAEVWAAIAASHGVAAVGLKAPGSVRGSYRGQVLVSRSQRVEAQRSLSMRRGWDVLAADDL